MSQNHKDVLKLLMPVSLGDTHDNDLAIEGSYLDAVQENVKVILNNSFVDTMSLLLPAWEYTLGLIAGDADTSARVDACTKKFIERGGLSCAYFIQLAADLGHTITISEGMQPFMVGWGEIGVSRIMKAEVRHWWEVSFESLNPDIVYYFRIGTSRMGDSLMSFGTTTVQDIIEDLKPAHTFVTFVFSFIINEQFSGVGTEESWTSVIENGCSLDPDSTSITPPANRGDENLEIDIATTGFAAYMVRDYGSEQTKTFTDIWVYIAAEGLTNTSEKEIASATDSADASAWILSIRKSYTGTFGFRFSIYNNSIWNNFNTFVGTTIGQWYKFSIQYNVDDLAWSWLIDDVVEDDGSLTGVYIAHLQKWTLGATQSTAQRSMQAHYAQIRVSTDEFHA